MMNQFFVWGLGLFKQIIRLWKEAESAFRVAQKLSLVLLTMACLFTGNEIFAQKTSDKTVMEEERQKLQRELGQIQDAYDALSGQSKNALHQLAALGKKIEIQEKYIHNIGKEIRLINDDIYYSAIEIKRLKNQMDTLRAHYARTVVYAYKNRSNYDYLNFIFSANSFNDAIKRVAYLKSYRGYREKQMQDIVKTSKLIDTRYKQQVSSIEKKKGALETRTNEYGVLELQKNEKDSLAKLLQSQAGALQKQITRKQQEDRQLKADIAAVVRKEIADAKRVAQEEARKKAAEEAQQRQEAWARELALENAKGLTDVKSISPVAVPAPSGQSAAEPSASTAAKDLKLDPVGAGKTTTVRTVPKSENNSVTGASPIAIARTPPPPPPAANKAPEGGYLNYKAEDIALNGDFSQNRGKLPHPVDGVITLGFGRYKIEGVGPDIVGDNPGVTYTAGVGAPVRSVFNGEVISISKVGNSSFVVLRHGKYFTVYSNLASVNIARGAVVSRGQTIGTVAADEETGSGKLDFILMIEEKNVDPRAWLR